MKFILLLVACFMAFNGAESIDMPTASSMLETIRYNGNEQITSLYIAYSFPIATLLNKFDTTSPVYQCIKVIQPTVDLIQTTGSASIRKVISPQMTTLSNIRNSDTNAINAFVANNIPAAQNSVNAIVASANATVAQAWSNMQKCIPA